MRTVETGRLMPHPAYLADQRSHSMGSDVMNALVELITNADDSYREMEESGHKPSGKIRIEIQRRRKPSPSIISVKDQAQGMSVAEMKTKLTSPGAPTSGFQEGRSRRGLFGRGAKEVVAFGETTFKSVKDGSYAECVILRSDDYKISEDRATTELCKALGVQSGRGTVATIEVDPTSFRIPQQAQLAEKLRMHYQLRDILSNPLRHVVLVDLNSREEENLRYHYPDIAPILVETFTVPGYPEAKAKMRVREHQEHLNEDRGIVNRSYRQNAILVKTSAACHENTLFGMENEPSAYWFSGELECDYIDTLIREYRNRQQKDPSSPGHPENNPCLLLDPERHGLSPSHPFVKALYSDALGRLSKLVEGKRKKFEGDHRTLETDQVRKRLDKFADWANQWLAQKLREAAEESGTGGGSDTPEWPIGITIIPGGDAEYFSIPFEARKTFSLRVRSTYPLPEGAFVSARSSDPQRVPVVSEVIPLTRLDNPCYAKAAFRLDGKELNAEAIITVSLNGYEKCIFVDVVPEKPISDVPPGISFEHKHYRVPFGKEKRMVVRLKPETLPAFADIKLACNNPHAFQMKHTRVRLSRVPSQAFLAGVACLTGRQLDAKGTIRAESGDLSAVAKLSVVQEKNSGINLQFKPIAKDFGSERARWSSDPPDLLQIGALHPSVKPYIGCEEDGFPGKDSRDYLLILAEIVAEALSARAVREAIRKAYPDGKASVDEFYLEQGNNLRELLPKAQEFLAPSAFQ